MGNDLIHMKLSLIITTFNRPQLLQKCLLSLSKQSLKPYELIISDDGSSEDILACVKQMLPLLDFKVTYVEQEDKGFRLSACRNNAVRVSTGDIVIFNDQDIVFTKNYLKTFAESYKKNRFLVSLPVRLTENQNPLLTDEVIENCDYTKVITAKQTQKIVKQYKKEKLYYWLYKLGLRKQGPKLRGGAFAIAKSDYIKINGFDENYKFWGNEDDDFGLRIYMAGLTGFNPFKTEYSIHIWHKTFHNDGERKNIEYHKHRKSQINKKNFVCKFGINNPKDKTEPKVIKLK